MSSLKKLKMVIGQSIKNFFGDEVVLGENGKASAWG